MVHENHLVRCPWCLGFPEYTAYHDTEWGIPVHSDPVHFEFLILEGAQAGLSWATVLKKRAGYRKMFASFNPDRVAKFTPARVEKILAFPGIIRNRAKVLAAVNNAAKFIEIQNEFGSFDEYIWRFVDGKPRVNHWKTSARVPATTKESDQLSADLRSRGFKFVGSTVIYAHMQACGLVNDHLVSCFRHAELTRGR